jgi:hypothetical protein
LSLAICTTVLRASNASARSAQRETALAIIRTSMRRPAGDHTDLRSLLEKHAVFAGV